MRLKPIVVPTVFVLLLGSLGIAGLWFYQRQAQAVRQAARDQIVTVAEFKAALLGNWHRERLDDAVGIAQDPLFVGAVRGYSGNGDLQQLDAVRASIQPSLREGKYDAFVLLDPQARVILSIGSDAPLAAGVAAHLSEVRRIRQPYLAPVTISDGRPSRLDLYAPVVEPEAQGPLAGFLVMRIDMEDFLLPLVRLWPAASDSAETLLVERSDREVRLVVPGLRWADVPTPHGASVPVSMAARGQETYFEGVDSRGVQALAAVRQVPGTRWALVARIDAQEVDGPLRTRMWLVTLSGLALIVAAFAGVLWLVSREQGALYRSMYEEARARQTVAGRLEAVVRLANDSIILADANGRILDVNDRAVETYGHAQDAFRALHLRALEAPGQATTIEAALNDPSASDGVRFETLHVRADGTTFPAEVSARMIEVEGQRFLQVLLRDISGPKRAARQIVRLNQLLEMRSRINQAVVHLRQRDQLLTAACEAAVGSGAFSWATVSRWHGGTRELEVLTSRGAVPAGFHPGHRFSIDTLTSGDDPGRAMATGQLAVSSMAAAVPVHEHGLVTAMFWVQAQEAGFFDERTERVLSEIGADLSFALEAIEADARLRQAEARFRTLFEAAPFAVWAIERESNRIIAANATASRQYGYTRDEFLAMPASQVFGPEDLQPSRERGDPAHPFPLPLATRHRRKDGTMLDAEVFCRAIDVEGRPAWFVAAADITERKHLEEQFRQAHRMEAVGRLAGGIAHDFNNLLTAISGFAALTLSDLPEGEPHHEHVEQISRAADRAASLTRQLLAFSRRQVLQLQPLDLHACVAELAQMLRRLIGEDVRLEMHLAPGTVIVEADRSQIELVLLNLSVNARDAMPTGGVLTIATSRVSVEAAPAVRPGLPALPGEYACISVSDTGIGMPAHILDRIFEPFFTTKPVGQGTGLGLSTVHGIVTQTGGHVAVESSPGEGTTFTFFLPVATTGPVSAAGPASPLHGSRGHESILLVEDDAGVRELAREVLEHGGYSVVEAPDALTALEVHASRAVPVNLVLTDIVMPGMSGIELARQLKEMHQDIQVLLMSGYPDDALERHGLGARPPSLLQKPFSPALLLARVRDLLDGKG